MVCRVSMSNSEVDLSHLVSEKSRAQAMLPVADRLLLIQKSHWFPYQRGDKVLAHLEWLYNHARNDRMPNYLIIGESMSGKSRILKRFAHEIHAAVVDPSKEADFRPVVMLEAPATPSARGFLQEVLIAAKAPFSSTAGPPQLMDQIDRVFSVIGVRVLIIDEIQHMLRGSSGKQREMRDQVKLLGNRLRLPVVAAGIPEARGAFSSDPQLNNRFHPVQLPRWRVTDRKGEVQEMMLILQAWQGACPLRKPSPGLPDLVDHLFDNTGGLLGHMINYLKMASEYALTSGEECITEKTFKKMGWIIPKEAKADYIVT